jgi:hypothetical protein
MPEVETGRGRERRENEKKNWSSLHWQVAARIMQKLVPVTGAFCNGPWNWREREKGKIGREGREGTRRGGRSDPVRLERGGEVEKVDVEEAKRCYCNSSVIVLYLLYVQ